MHGRSGSRVCLGTVLVAVSTTAVFAAGCGRAPSPADEPGGGPGLSTDGTKGAADTGAPSRTSNDTAAPGGGGGNSRGGSGGGADGTPPSGTRIDTRTVLFDDGGRRFPRVSTVLRTDTDRARFPGWFAGASAGGPETAKKVAARLKGTDLKTNVLVAFTATTGCSKPHGAQLYAHGRLLAFRPLDQPSPPPECYAPYQVTAVFEVPKNRLPDRPRFADGPGGAEKPDAAGPGELASFTRIDPEGTERTPDAPEAAEVTERGDLDRYLRRLPEKTAARVKAKLDARKRAPEPGERLFAFRLSGCRLTGAELHAETGELSAVAVGGENVRCIRAEHYVAIFALPSPLVPDRPLPQL